MYTVNFKEIIQVTIRKDIVILFAVSPKRELSTVVQIIQHLVNCWTESLNQVNVSEFKIMICDS